MHRFPLCFKLKTRGMSQLGTMKQVLVEVADMTVVMINLKSSYGCMVGDFADKLE